MLPRVVHTLAVLALACAASGFVPHRAVQTAPSQRIKTVCDSFSIEMADLTNMAGTISDREESAGVASMAGVAQLATERCLSVHSLLFAYELIRPGPDKAKVGEWVAFRLNQYAILKSDIEYANKMIALTKSPGVAREAQALRDRLRAFAELTSALRPKA